MKNNLKTVLLLGLLSGLLVGLGRLLGGPGGAILGFAFAGVMNLAAYWFSDKIALRMSRARPVGEAEAPDLYATVRNLAQAANLPMPKVYTIPSDQPNAFATGRNPNHAAVAVTQGILKVLTRDELEGVLAHELAHVGNRDILIASVAATVAGAISAIASMARWGAIFGGRDDDEGPGYLGVVVTGIFASVAALIIQMAISRSREFQADRRGAEICGRPLSLASALGKIEAHARQIPMPVNPSAAPMFIVNPLRGGAFGSFLLRAFSTHPPTEERIRRLEQIAMGR